MATQEWKEENIEKLRTYRREWYARNKEAEREKAKVRRKQARHEMKLWFKELKSSLSCKVCGESEPVCLDFHHKSKTTKKFEIGSQTQSRSKTEILKEIDKCVVLCANCHRKVHAKVIKL